MKKHKKKITLNGQLLLPLEIGHHAFFASEGQIYRTSRVVDIYRRDRSEVCFETENSDYHLFFQPTPARTVQAVYPKCA